MANVFDFLKPKALLNRNGFDLSQRHVYSQKAGMIVPVLALDCIPQDYHEIELLSLCRTLPLETDAFTRLKVSFNFGFVPYQQLWHEWDEFILQTKERFSSLDREQLPSQVPSIKLSILLGKVAELLSWYRIHRALLDNTLSPDQESALRALLPGANSYWLDDFYYPRYQNALRLLDMLGYGAFYAAFNNLAAIPFVLPDATHEVDQDYYAALTNQQNHFDALYGDMTVNLFRFLAYNKFCQDFFRSTQYEVLKPELFNIDGQHAQLDPDDAREIISSLSYCLYKKDMFTGLYATPQFGSVSSVDLGQFSLTPKMDGNPTQSMVLGVSTETNKVLVRRSNGAGNVPGSGLFESSASIDVYQLKKAEMFQKWKEDKLRAGNKLRNQSISQWGDSFRYLQDNYSDYIKEITMNISIDEVTNMSAQGAIALGELAGKAVGTTNGKVTYKCSDFGVLLCVAYIQPVAEYDAVGIDKNNTLAEPFDFATPVFENLGLEAIYAYQLIGSLPNATSGVYNDSIVKTLGFAPRYLNYKTAVDKVHGEFMSLGHGGDGGSIRGLAGSLSHWTTPRRDLELLIGDTGSYPLELLKVNPAVLDTIFVAEADGKQSSDQFLFNTNFIVKSVRGLSILGLPRW